MQENPQGCEAEIIRERPKGFVSYAVGLANPTTKLELYKVFARNPKDSLLAEKGKVYDFGLQCGIKQ